MHGIRNSLMKMASAGCLPDDPPADAVKKQSLTVMAIPFAFLGFLWGGMYWAFGLWFSGWIPFGYGIFSILTIIFFFITKRYRLFVFSQLLLILWLPFLLQWSLGGFYSASSVMIWALIAPLASLVFQGTRVAVDWFLAFVAFGIFSGFIDPMLAKDGPKLPETMITTLFVMNMVGASTIAFLTINYFVRKSES